MLLRGLQKTTLLDFPGKVACTVFTGGCNFRCPFCHNASLIENLASDERLSEENFFAFLDKRRGLTDGVCITGGEPLLQKDIIPFIERIKSMGFLVKLDTNGSYPEVLEALISRSLVDYVAMDIKNAKDAYLKTAGARTDVLPAIEKSVALLKEGRLGIGYLWNSQIDVSVSCSAIHLATDFDYLPYSLMSGYDKGLTWRIEANGELSLGDYLSLGTRYILRIGDVDKNIFQKWSMEARAYL